MAYDAFISYSHAGDGLLAPRLQQALGRFAKPWWQRRALRVFRDETALSVNPGLWSSITDALDQTEWFVLLASPDAAQSEWVNREVAYWCTNHDPQRVLPVVTEGGWVWDEATGDFDWAACTAVPLALKGVFTEEPRHIDMQWARSDAQLDLHNGRFRDQVAEIAAPMHGLAKDDLEGEDVREHRRTLRIAWGAVALLVLLLTASVASALVAVRSADEARASEQEAVEAQVEADRQAALAVASAAEAQQRKQEADESAAEASRQRNQADASALDADRQRAEADRNAATAEAQRRAADAASAQLAVTVDELTMTNGELDQANEDLASTNDQLDQTNQALASTNEALDQTNQDLASSNDRLSEANDTLTAQAANLDASRLAALAAEESARRLDVALLLAAEAQKRAATDARLPMSTLFRLLEADGRGLERVLPFRSTAQSVAPVVAVGQQDERLATVVKDDNGATELSLWAGDAPPGTAPRTFQLPSTDAYPEKATFGAGGRYLFLQTAMPVAIVDPDAPLPPPVVGVQVIDVTTGHAVVSYSPAPFAKLVVSATGDSAAVQTCLPAGVEDCEPTVALIDARSGTVLREGPGSLPSYLGVGANSVPGARTDPDFSSDGERLLVFAPPGEFQIWSLRRPNVTVTLYTPAAGTFTVPSFDSTGDVVVGSVGPGQVDLFDAADGSLIRTVGLTETAGVRAVATTSGGDVLAVLQPGALTLLRTAGEPVTADVHDCADEVTTSPRQQWFITGGAGCAVTDMVDATTARHVGPMAGGNVGITAADGITESIAFQMKPRQTYPVDDSSFGVFDLTADRWLDVSRGLDAGTAPVFEPTSGTVLVGFGNPAALRVYTADGSGRILPGSGARTAFFGSSDRFAVADASGTLAIWDLERVRAPERVGTLPYVDEVYIPPSVLSPRGDLAASVNNDTYQSVVITRLGSDDVVDEISVPDGYLWQPKFVDEGRLLLVNDSFHDHVVRYDVSSGSMMTPIVGQLVSTSPNGRYIAVRRGGVIDVRVIDLHTDQEIAQFFDLEGVFAASQAAISSDGRHIVVNGDVYDIPTRQFLRTLPIDLDTISSLVFSPSGDRLYHVTQRDDTILEVIDTATWNVDAVRRIRHTSEAARSLVSQLQPSPDGKMLWVSGELLDAATLTPLGKPGDLLPQVFFALGDVVFTRDSTSLLAVVGADVHRFTVGGDALAADACALAGRNLSVAERALFMTSPGAPACPQWPAGR
jgi:WD40 repeat protein